MSDGYQSSLPGPTVYVAATMFTFIGTPAELEDMVLRAFWTGLILFMLTSLLPVAGSTPAAALPFPTEPAAARARPPARPELVVALHEEPPYVIRTGEGRWDGIAVDLWRKMAEELEVSYRFRPVTRTGYVDAIASGAVDVGLNPPVMAGGVERLRFTQPYHTSTLAVVTRADNAIWTTVEGIFTLRFAKIAAILAGAFLLVGMLIWAFERRENDEQFQPSPARGIWSGMWWAGVTMTTIGYGDKAPKTVAGRILALLWMLVAMGVTATLTASVVGATSESRLVDGDPIEDLRAAKQIGVVREGEGAAIVQGRKGSEIAAFESVEAGLDALEGKRIDALVADSAAVAYAQGKRQKVRVRTLYAPRLNHSMAVADDTLLAQPIEHALLEIIGERAWHDNLKRWLGP